MGWQDMLARMPAFLTPAVISRRRPAAVGALAVLLWLAGLVQLAVPGAAPCWLVPVLVMGVSVLVLPDLSRSLRAPLTLSIAVLAGLMLQSWQADSVRAALDFAGPFGAFLVSVAILRGTLLSPARVAAARTRLAAHDPAGRRSVLLLLSCLLGGVFSIGGFPLLAPLLEGMDPAETDRAAEAILCGNALALFWSPFTIGMGFAAAAVGVAGGFAYLPTLLVAAAIGLVLALAVHGVPSPVALRQVGATFRPLLPPFAVAIAATLGMAAALHLRVADAVVLTAPALALLAWAAGAARGHSPSAIIGTGTFAPTVLRCAGESVRDLPVYIAGFALARALAASGVFDRLAALLPATGLGPALLLPLLASALALLGLPALVSGGVIAAASAALLPDAQLATRLLLTLFAWVATTMLSVTGMSVLATSSTFGTGIRRLILGRNLLVTALLAGVLALAAR
jgi:hypothetical protein